MGDVGYLSRSYNNWLHRTVFRRDIRLRRGACNAINTTETVTKVAQHIRQNGYYLGDNQDLNIEISNLSIFSDELLFKDLSQVQAERKRSGSSKKYWLDFLGDCTESDLEDLLASILYNRQLLNICSLYLKEVPLFSYASLFYSPPGAEQLNMGSMNWHLDNECGSQLKLFVPLLEVNSLAGPTEILSREFSEIKKYPNYPGYFDDNQFLDAGLDSNGIFKFVSPVGKFLLADTSQVFHRGSRTQEKPRLQLIVAFTPLSGNRLPIKKFKKVDPRGKYPGINNKIAKIMESNFN